MKNLIFRIKAAIRAFKMPYHVDADFRVEPISDPNYSVGLTLIHVDSWDRVCGGGKLSIGGIDKLLTVKRIIIEVAE
jgi:hypothetical protein